MTRKPLGRLCHIPHGTGLLLGIAFVLVVGSSALHANESSPKKELHVSEMLKVMKKSKCYRNHKAPLELVFLIDRSSKKVLKTAPRIIQIVEQLKEENPGSRFGISYYADFQCTDWHPEEECHQRIHEEETHMEPEGCYSRGSNLTGSVNKVKTAAWSIDFLGASGKASGMAAVLLAAVDPKMGWTPTKGEGVPKNKVLFVITDDATSCCHKTFGTRHPPQGDGNDQCQFMENPTPEVVGQKLRKNDVFLFLALGPGERGEDTVKSWTSMVDRMRIEHGMADMEDDDNEELLQKFYNFLIEVAFHEGPLWCNDDVIPKHGEEEDSKETSKEKREKQEVTRKRKAKEKKEEDVDDTMLEVTFLVDRSSKKALEVTPKLLDIVEDIKEYFPKSRFALSFYADFACPHWLPRGECQKAVKMGEQHMEEEGCYSFNKSLTLYPQDFHNIPQDVTLLGGTGLNAGIAAIMMTAADKKIGWRTNNKQNKFKVIFLVSDRGTHCCSKKYGPKKIPRGDGRDKCSTMNNPTPEFVGKRLQENGFSLFLMLGKRGEEDDTVDNWSDMMGRMRVSSGMADLAEDDANRVFKKFKHFLDKQITRREDVQSLKKHVPPEPWRILENSKEDGSSTVSPRKGPLKRKKSKLHASVAVNKITVAPVHPPRPVSKVSDSWEDTRVVDTTTTPGLETDGAEEGSALSGHTSTPAAQNVSSEEESEEMVPFSPQPPPPSGGGMGLMAVKVSSEESEDQQTTSTTPSPEPTPAMESTVGTEVPSTTVTDPGSASDETEEDDAPSTSHRSLHSPTDEPELVTGGPHHEHSEEVPAHIGTTKPPRSRRTRRPRRKLHRSTVTPSTSTTVRSTTTPTTTPMTTTTTTTTTPTTTTPTSGIVFNPYICQLASMMGVSPQVTFSDQDNIFNIGAGCPEILNQASKKAHVASPLIPVLPTRVNGQMAGFSVSATLPSLFPARPPTTTTETPDN